MGPGVCWTCGGNHLKRQCQKIPGDLTCTKCKEKGLPSTGHNNAAHDAKFEYTKIMADNKESSSKEETTLEQKGRKVNFKKHRPRPRPRKREVRSQSKVSSRPRSKNSSSRDSSRSRSRHKSNNSRTSGDTPFNSSTYTT